MHANAHFAIGAGNMQCSAAPALQGLCAGPQTGPSDPLYQSCNLWRAVCTQVWILVLFLTSYEKSTSYRKLPGKPGSLRTR